MINRALLRIKIVQTLYAYYKSEGKTTAMVERELFYGLERTYDLYFQLLLLTVEVKRYAEARIEYRKNKLQPTNEDLNPNTRFIDNQFIAKLENNLAFKERVSTLKLSWVNDMDVVKSIYNDIVDSDLYKEYMESETTNFDKDKELWRKIFKNIILSNPDLDDSLEEQSIYWANDVEVIASFVLKSIKRFNEDDEEDAPLLPMFKDREDEMFAKKLLSSSIRNATDYKAYVVAHLQNWEPERVAFMDMMIMQVAIAEILEFPTIPVNVSLNEYIEIAKNYSTDRSGTFVNGVLDKIVTTLKNENKLIKVKMI
jgi:N utilization substance protein B